MSEWKDAFKILPKMEGEYLVCRMSDDDDSDIFYTIERFEKQDVYERRYSQEFKQQVNVLIKSSEPMFKESSSFVLKWMEIPK